MKQSLPHRHWAGAQSTALQEGPAWERGLASMLGQEQQRKHWAREKDLTSAPRISQISNSQVLVPIVCWALYKHSQAVIIAWDQAEWGVYRWTQGPGWTERDVALGL